MKQQLLRALKVLGWCLLAVAFVLAYADLITANSAPVDSSKFQTVSVDQDYWVQGTTSQSNVKCYKGVAIVTEYQYDAGKAISQSIIDGSKLCEAK